MLGPDLAFELVNHAARHCGNGAGREQRGGDQYRAVRKGRPKAAPHWCAALSTPRALSLLPGTAQRYRLGGRGRSSWVSFPAIGKIQIEFFIPTIKAGLIYPVVSACDAWHRKRSLRHPCNAQKISSVTNRMGVGRALLVPSALPSPLLVSSLHISSIPYCSARARE